MSEDNNKSESKISITYRFASNETSEITVDMLVDQEGVALDKAIEICEVLQALDIQDEKLERKERRRHVSLSIFDDGIKAPRPRNEPASVEEQLIEKEVCDELFDIIERRLTPLQKQRLLERIVEDKSYRQIGAEEGRNHKTILESVEEAIEKIKRFLN